MRCLCLTILTFTLNACSNTDKTASNVDANVRDITSVQSHVRDTLSSGDWFTAKCELLCDEEHGKFLDSKKLEKYGTHDPYDFKETTKRDSVIIAFDFIADCCMDFAGGAQIKNDTLILEYQPPSDSLAVGCDCYCDYRMIYRISKRNKNWIASKTDYKRRG